MVAFENCPEAEWLLILLLLLTNTIIIIIPIVIIIIILPIVESSSSSSSSSSSPRWSWRAAGERDKPISAGEEQAASKASPPVTFDDGDHHNGDADGDDADNLDHHDGEAFPPVTIDDHDRDDGDEENNEYDDYGDDDDDDDDPELFDEIGQCAGGVSLSRLFLKYGLMVSLQYIERPLR